MGLFRKKGDMDFLDYTLLQKKGLLKVPAKQTDMLDLTMRGVSSPATSATNPFGFLDSMAGAANSLSVASGTGGAPEFSSLKLKLEDVEYKLERLVDRLALIESKLEAFEGKVR